jgi:hypothetical protein
MVFSGTILGFIVSKEGKIMDPKKVEALVDMLVPITPKEIQVSNGWHSFTGALLKTLPLNIMSIITKLFKKFEVFEWIIKCQNAWEIKNRYQQAPISISPN